MVQTRQDPFELLRKMQQESLENAPGLPQEVEVTKLWSGVAFRLGEIMLVTPLDNVLEILPPPPMTPVPGVKKWLKGVANVRGNLITIIDLPEYYSKPPVFMDDKARLLIMNVPGLNAGLLVNEVFGLRHFDEDLERQDLSGLDDPVLVQLNGAFLRDNVLWGVFDMRSLAESSSFRHVAA
ncbi:MAG: chemotaxis protein CheW [Gammaproteobacteria bacterium]|nr:chemotaxis protein CheW [Gammaproteobacteria bacterium]MDH3369697.1 chemotaxis protein CheW [Gammaproteobacteria bacterium]MDH3405669.1 chemotaxis protein CheW [Gammaproteobacteria bacterium]MDH5486250.1 chemotaxis protein CheW [Gammaproteobacteria bacterium]